MYGRFKDHMDTQLRQIREGDQIAFALDKFRLVGRKLGAIPASA